MAWRYRKRIKIAPGININLSKSGINTTIGPRGASVNIGKNGTYLNTGIPGTGLYSRQKIGGGSHGSSTYNTPTQTNNGCNGCLMVLEWAVVIIMLILTIAGLGLENKTTNDILGILFTASIVVVLVYFLCIRSKKEEVATSEISTDCLTEDRFNLIKECTYNLHSFMVNTLKRPDVREKVDAGLNFTDAKTGGEMDIDLKIQMTMFGDVYRCYKGLGHDIYADNLENIGIYIFWGQVVAPEVIIDYSKHRFIKSRIANNIKEVMTSVEPIANLTTFAPSEFVLEKIFASVDEDLASQYTTLMYRFASSVAKANGTIEENEADFLSKIKKEKTEGSSANGANIKISNIDESKENTAHEKINTALHISGDVDPYFEEAANAIVISQNCSTSMLQRRFQIGYNRAGRLLDQLEEAGIVGPAKGVMPRDVLITDVNTLNKIINIIREGASDINKVQPVEQPKRKYERKAARKSLETLIGLDGVKEEVTKLTNLIKVQQMREEQGLKNTPISYHCVFTGNPGTGKTTVARIVASIYKELGILKKGQLVETDRSGLVAEYVGQTAVKTNKIIDSALDGVLFIDEAYSLVQGSKEDFGTEAISTLLKRMEDDRDRLVVILAGYRNEMKQFIDSNPGLQSRFSRYIDFADYNADELMQIFMLNLSKNDYTITEDAKASVKAYLENAVAHKDVNFGNARFVRNTFEKIVENQAMRLAGVSDINANILTEITIDDIKF